MLTIENLESEADCQKLFCLTELSIRCAAPQRRMTLVMSRRDATRAVKHGFKIQIAGLKRFLKAFCYCYLFCNLLK